MRGFGLLASLILLAGLAACAEAAGPNYAYAPGEIYGPWPEGYYCCGPRLFPVRHFHHHGHAMAMVGITTDIGLSAPPAMMPDSLLRA